MLKVMQIKINGNLCLVQIHLASVVLIIHVQQIRRFSAVLLMKVSCASVHTMISEEY